MQYDTVTDGKICMDKRVLRSEVAGFSKYQALGLKYLMLSIAFWTRLSAYSRSLGVFALDLAMEYWVHSGLAKITSQDSLG